MAIAAAVAAACDKRLRWLSVEGTGDDDEEEKGELEEGNAGEGDGATELGAETVRCELLAKMDDGRLDEADEDVAGSFSESATPLFSSEDFEVDCQANG